MVRAIQVYEGEGIAPPPAMKPGYVFKRFVRGALNVDDIGYEVLPAQNGHVVIRQTYGGRWAPGKLGCWSFAPNMNQSEVTIYVPDNGGHEEFWFTRESLRAFIRKHCR